MKIGTSFSSTLNSRGPLNLYETKHLIFSFFITMPSTVCDIQVAVQIMFCLTTGL